MKTYKFWYRIHKPFSKGKHRSSYVTAETKQEAIEILKQDARSKGSIADEISLDGIWENNKYIKP